MTQRLNYAQQSPELFKKFMEFSMALKSSVIDEKLQALVEIRASQINGCGFCLDMHVKQAKIHGETELRLYHVAIWRESNLFIPRERAALAWTEALTKLPEGGVPDEIYERVRGQLSEKEISDLTFVVMAINAWNRVNVGFKTVPGTADKAYGLDKAGLN
ncbi:carboxymuconolactone decarboxylase family protein [Rhizobium laguerreae]|uniref:AhpD family alkylhydroperoxidase n=3 Tax=Rhizobium TaxID=379 RepID=A0A7W6UPN0_9HYPH|nr:MULTISPECIES: carboxymuconolactone decarboxylase family protein [Rhizobium]MBB4441136.1 AhpD family alkylhydroperoxidase [Rhizobium esperanzae]MBY3379528.1 carboxymuconolactone decarboxylase family protein [Rhizobium laguerreae]MBY5366810.1 carboxymuconolactone decarboxylase family protein [Rhizobium leguminosarum]MBY5448522.1 carboxymuconolactone decarboxylase family protein [Rhizobium leguminosarum]MBY5820308.1 carboxymuconolactone decarboxylase family protein [Rhizobium leguminosarum]